MFEIGKNIFKIFALLISVLFQLR